MPTIRSAAALAAMLATALFATGDAVAQKSGGTLRIQHADTPPSPSLHEEVTVSVAVPFMSIYNNLVIYDQNVPVNSFDSIRPELATAWKISEDGRSLTFTLRQGVKWHDGQPFTAKDVVCTVNLLKGVADQKVRRNPRSIWFENVEDVTANGDFEVTLRLKQPQPSMLALLAAGWSAVYPCHVTPAQMRRAPIGTGPFKFVELKANERIKLVKNPDYWKPGRPYLDAIEFTIISDRSTRMLSFTSGQFDMTFPTDVTVALLKQIQKDAPQAQCILRPLSSINVILERDKPPFNDPRLRRAVALSLDRKAFTTILSEGHDLIGGAMMPSPPGIWGMNAEQMKDLPGYGDVEKARAEAQALMRDAGYGPDKRLKVKVTTRNTASYRDPAVIFIDQLRSIYVDGELEIIDSVLFFNRLFKRDFTAVLNATGSSIDDPDQHYIENYACEAQRNYNGYCSPEATALMKAQSLEPDVAKRRALVHQLERKLVEDVARPIILHTVGAACMQPSVKGLTIMQNSIYNGWRFEDIWLDK